jgi:N-methylhydantoinase A/oxoprolinase/acetone carboxylase beta subunit
MTDGYALGIDAGGTYTDIALLDLGREKVITYAKSLTTWPDPSEGIYNALSQLDPKFLFQVRMVSLATTFATNALVENRGGVAGLILIGYEEKPKNIPVDTPILMIEGGHTVTGEEKAPLDLITLNESLGSFVKGMEAIAITGFFSIRNPEHEQKVALFVRQKYDLPIVLGHQLSMRLDAMKRATTAWWNARLIPLIRNLIKATEEVLSNMHVTAPLMIVRGDGTLMSVETSLDRPIDTILSGPAASILGAKFLSQEKNALIVDIGGTTTDMSLLLEGKVAINPQGAKVGKWETHVEALKVRTIGLGGDSLISHDKNGNIFIGPQRVIPLCLFAENFPEVINLLKIILRRSRQNMVCEVNPCSFFIKNQKGRYLDNEVPPPCEANSRIVSEFLLFEDIKKWQMILDLKRDEMKGDRLQSALTPTDICVASRKFSFGVSEASELGVLIYAKNLGMDVTTFLKVIEEEICKKICLEALCFISETNVESLEWVKQQWFKKNSKSRKGIAIDLQVSLTAPVIGIGAPAATYLPGAFQKMNVQCIFPEHYSIAGAVGAVVGVVSFVLIGEIHPTTSGKYSLHTSKGKEIFDTYNRALDQGKQILESLARVRMLKEFVVDPFIHFSKDEKRIKTSSGQDVFLSTILKLHATGRPNIWKKEKKLD